MTPRNRALPISLRISENRRPVTDRSVHTSEEVRDYVKDVIGNADREMFIIIHMNPKNNILDRELHAVGDVDASAIYPRQVFKSALLHNSSAIIFAHNHPSGDPDPSLCDKQITMQLVHGAMILGIKVLDHVIVGPGKEHYSFADEGLIDDYEALSGMSPDMLSLAEPKKTLAPHANAPVMRG
jgi:DNA repair protein RadC